MFHLTNKAWTPYRYYSCHSPGDGWVLVLHACWRQGQGLLMGIDSKNILKCVKHLVASIKIIWLVLLLDWDLDLWFSAEIHSWPRTSTWMGVTWATAGPMTVANSHGYNSHLNTWSQQQSPHCCSALCLRLNVKDLWFGEWCWPASPFHVTGKAKAGESNCAFTPAKYQLWWQPPFCPSYLDTLTASAGVWSGPCPAQRAAVCAACGKTGISASDQRGAVGLNCPPAGCPLKCHLKIQPHKQNLYTPFVFVKNVSMSNIKHMLFMAKSQAPAPTSVAMSLLKISRKLNREGWCVSFDFGLSGDPGLQAEAQLNLTVNMGCTPCPVQVTGGWPE